MTDASSKMRRETENEGLMKDDRWGQKRSITYSKPDMEAMISEKYPVLLASSGSSNTRS